MAELPNYDDLPLVDGARTSWGVWGDDDRLGTLNLLDAGRARRAARLVRKGRVFRLDAPLDEIDPPLFGRRALEHRVEAFPGGRAFDDHITFLNTQSSSQWDGFRHIRDPERGFYNGLDPEHLGIDHWARAGLAGRGVLADIVRFREEQGQRLDPSRRDVVEPGELLATLESHGVEAEPGDVLLVRTGWLGWYRSLDPGERAGFDPTSGLPGLANHEGMARLLWDLHVAAVAADNPALEASPPRDGHLHADLLPRLGIPIGELFDLDDLATDCAAHGTYEFMVTSAPLHLRGGVASPPNALAIT